MKKTLLAIAITLMPAVAFAGSAEPFTPKTPEHSWTGFSVGLGVTTRLSFGQSVTVEGDGYDRQCLRGDRKHYKDKCKVSLDDFNNSPEIQALPHVNSPWNADLPNGPVRYNNTGYNGIWLNGEESFSFTSASDSAAPSVGRGWAYQTAVVERFKETFTLSENEELTGVAHVRYLHDFGTLVVGGEVGMIFGDDAYAEVQGGIDMGRALAYGAVGTDHYAAGIDIAFGEKRNWVGGLRYMESFDGYSRPVLRVERKF